MTRIRSFAQDHSSLCGQMPSNEPTICAFACSLWASSPGSREMGALAHLGAEFESSPTTSQWCAPWHGLISGMSTLRWPLALVGPLRISLGGLLALPDLEGGVPRGLSAPWKRTPAGDGSFLPHMPIRSLVTTFNVSLQSVTGVWGQKSWVRLCGCSRSLQSPCMSACYAVHNLAMHPQC